MRKRFSPSVEQIEARLSLTMITLTIPTGSVTFDDKTGAFYGTTYTNAPTTSDVNNLAYLYTDFPPPPNGPSTETTPPPLLPLQPTWWGSFWDSFKVTAFGPVGSNL